MKRRAFKHTAIWVIALLGFCVWNLSATFSHAQFGGPPPGTPGTRTCAGCVQSQCDAIPAILSADHEAAEPRIIENITQEFSCYRSWFANDTQANCPQNDRQYTNILSGLIGITEELSAVGMQQIFSIGKFIDAENQLETQRRFQELQFQAHKDYQPSEDYCRIGTTVRSMADSERKSQVNKAAMNEIQMARHLAKNDSSGADGINYDLASRWDNFRQNYCDPRDNNWTNSRGTGLFFACGNTNTPRGARRTNIDIDYTNLIEQNRTLDLDMTTNNSSSVDQIDVTALANNLYGHEILTRQLTDNALQTQEGQLDYLFTRSVAARRNVAQNSFNAITSIKAAGSNEQAGSAAPFMHRIIADLGISEGDATLLIGENPSYYAQLELLGKTMYQNSNFFANLYDKPVNVQRKATAMKAIDIMLDRSVFESELRQEMLLSVLLATRQGEKFELVKDELVKRRKSGGGQ